MENSPPVQQRGAIQSVRLRLENTPVLLCLIMSIIRCEGKTKHTPAAFSPSPSCCSTITVHTNVLLEQPRFEFITSPVLRRSGFETVLPAELQLLFCVSRQRPA